MTSEEMRVAKSAEVRKQRRTALTTLRGLLVWDLVVEKLGCQTRGHVLISLVTEKPFNISFSFLFISGQQQNLLLLVRAEG